MMAFAIFFQQSRIGAVAPFEAIFSRISLVFEGSIQTAFEQRYVDYGRLRLSKRL